MRARWLIIPLVLLLPAVAFAQKARGNDREAVVQAERQWADATVRCDTIALARMFSDSLVYVHTNGVADNKVVVHHVEADAVRRNTDTHNPRPFHIEGDSMILGNRTTWSRTLVREKPSDQPNPARQATNRPIDRAMIPHNHPLR